MGFLDDVIDNAGEPYKGGKGFEYGTHEVMIGSAAAVQKKTQNDPDASVIEVEVFDEADNDKTATATLYFHTEGGAKMAVTKILGIMIHNVGEDKKDKVRAAAKKLFAGIDDPKKARDVAVQLMNDKMVGKYKAFLVVEPRGSYKTSSYGDIWHYAAEPENAAPVDEAVVATGGTDITHTKEGEDLPDFDDL